MPAIVLTAICFVSAATAQTPPLLNDMRIVYGSSDDPDDVHEVLPPHQTPSRERDGAPDFYHNEVFVGFGRVAFFGATVLGYYLGNYWERNAGYTTMFSAGYKYRFRRVVSLGGTYSLGMNFGEAFSAFGYDGREIGDTRTYHHTVAVECDFRYLTLPLVTLYSTVGAAVTYLQRSVKIDSWHAANYSSMKEYRVFPNFHASVVGVKFGEYRLGGFLELGLGYKGLVNFGAYARF